MRELALIANQGSGNGDADRAAEVLGRLGIAVTVAPIAEIDRLDLGSVERIAVAGGDGSIGGVAALAAGAGLPLAVIPCGTANDFARQAGLPADLEEACRLAAEGTEVRSLELAWAGRRPFVNVVSAGLAPAAAEEAAGMKERLGALAYPLGAVGAGLRRDPIQCSITADGEPLFSGSAWQVSVASSGAFGGGSTLLADHSDGKLDVVAIPSGSRARLVKVAYGLAIGTVEDQAGVVTARAGVVELTLEDGAGLNVDGELLDAADLGAGDTIGFEARQPGFDLIVG